jgi:hypothetical protein
MIHSLKIYWRNSRHKALLIVGAAGAVTVVMAGLVTGGLVWHQKPGFCGICHTPMNSFVEGYRSGDKTLMVTSHATGKSILHNGDQTLTTTSHTTGNKTLVCLDCHKPTIKEQVTEASHWITGNYYFPLKQRTFGTRSFCLSEGCHIEADIIKATKDYGGAVLYNQHEPPHGRQECYSCHSVHGQSVLMCNQCHKLKLPDGWTSPAPNGVITTK